MAKHFHYLVYARVDGDRITWVMDDCESLALPDWIWDEDSDEWSPLTEDLMGTDVSLMRSLNAALERLNFNDE